MTTILKHYLLILKTLFLSLTLFYSCKTYNNVSKVELKTKGTNDYLIIRGYLKEKKITYIKFPLALEIFNNSNNKKSFKRINYSYFSKPEESLSIQVSQNGKKVSNNFKKDILPNRELVFNLYTRHFVGVNKELQKDFVKYLDKMLKEKKDTLHIGTVSEFRKKHKELFEKLTKNDSISIQFLNDRKLGERITVPVEW